MPINIIQIDQLVILQVLLYQQSKTNCKNENVLNCRKRTIIHQKMNLNVEPRVKLHPNY